MQLMLQMIFIKKQATSVPKAARRQPGVDVTARQTFYGAPGSQQLDSIHVALHEEKKGINPSGYIPDRPAAPNRIRAQGINKLEGTTFNENSLTNKTGQAPLYNEGAETWGGGSEETHYAAPSRSAAPPPVPRGGAAPPPVPRGGAAPPPVPEHHEESYDQGYGQEHHEDQGGYEQHHEDQGGYEQHHEDQGHYDQGTEGQYDQGGEYQGEYAEGTGQYYDESQGGEYYEEGQGEYYEEGQ